MTKTKNPKVVMAAGTPITPISATERREIHKRIKKRQKQLRKRYPEVHGKFVYFITHGVEDGTLYIGIRSKDKTDFSPGYDCQMVGWSGH
jgi:hypothetical protein